MRPALALTLSAIVFASPFSLAAEPFCGARHKLPSLSKKIAFIGPTDNLIPYRQYIAKKLHGNAESFSRTFGAAGQFVCSGFTGSASRPRIMALSQHLMV